MKNLLVVSLAALTACAMPAGDSGDSGNGTDTSTGTGTGTAAPVVDACNFTAWKLCIEVTDFADARAWCDELDANPDYAAANIQFTAGSGCPETGRIGMCTVDADVSMTDDYPVDGVAYYYTGFSGNAEDACEDDDGAGTADDGAGGTYTAL